MDNLANNTEFRANGFMQNHFLAVGGAHWDILGRSSQNMALYDDVGGRIRRMVGGVAGPIAMKLAHLGLDVAIKAYAGHDELGDALIGKLEHYHVKTEQVVRGDLPTDVYMGIEAPNGLIAAIADCHSLEAVSMQIIDEIETLDLSDTTLIIDGNLHADALQRLAQSAIAPQRLILVPASPGKINRFLPFRTREDVRVYVNLREANALANGVYPDAPSAAKAIHALGFRAALVSNGAEEAAFINADEFATALPPKVNVKRFTGAGDTLTAHHIFARNRSDSAQDALTYALQATANFISEEDLDV